MRRSSGRILVLLGIILAIGSFVGVMSLMRHTQQTPAEAPVVTRRVVVAARDIPAYTKLTSDSLTTKEVPLDLVPPMAVTNVYSVTDHIALTNIYADQVIMETMIATADSDDSLLPSLSVPPGMVAMTIPVNEVTGVAEALREGDHVDVIVSLNVLDWDAQGNESKPEYSAQFTIQDVEIVHLGSWAPPVPDETTSQGASSSVLGAGGGRTGGTVCEPLSIVTLLVEPQDALVLKYALDTKVKEGRDAYTLVLRAKDSDERYTTEAVNQEYMVQRFNFARPPFIIIK